MGVRSILWLALALLTPLAGTSCKRDDCARAIDHVGHLSWLESQKMLEKFRPQMRELVANRFGARCHDPAFAKCVLAAQDPAAVARCEHPE